MCRQHTSLCAHFSPRRSSAQLLDTEPAERKSVSLSLCSESSPLRAQQVVSFHHFIRVEAGKLSCATEDATQLQEAARLLAGAAPVLCSRMSTTAGGIGHSAEKAAEKGSPLQAGSDSPER